MLKVFSTCIKARMDTSDHGLTRAFRTLRAFTNRLPDIKNSLVSVWNWSWMYWGKLSPRIEIKGLGSEVVWALPRKLSFHGHVLIRTVLLVLVLENHTWSLSTYFSYILCNLSTWISVVNPLTSNDHYRGRTAPLTSKRCILYIYSTNIGTEYFKHGIYSMIFFSSICSLFHNSNVFVSCIIHILYAGCDKI